jgi:hypothetical protein
MVALVGNAPTSRALQARANLSQLWGHKVARTTSAALALCSARQAGVDAVRPRSHGPPRCCPVLYRLRGDCITAMLAGRKVLQSGFAPASRSYPDRAGGRQRTRGSTTIQEGAECGIRTVLDSISYRRMKSWYPSRDLRSARSVKSRLLRSQSLRGVKMASAVGFAPTYIRLRI